MNHATRCLCASLGLAAALASALPTFAADETVNGLELTVSADKPYLLMTPRNLKQATKDTPRWNVRPVKLTFTFTNVSDKPIKLDTYDLAWSRMSLEVQGPDAESLRTVKKEALRDMLPPRESDYPTIEPGKSFFYSWQPSFPGNTFGEGDFHLLKPGEYRLKAVYEREAKDEEAVDIPHVAAGSWVGSVTSNELILAGVVPGEPVGGIRLTISTEKTVLKMTPHRAVPGEEHPPTFDVEPAEVKVSLTNVSDKPIKVGGPTTW